MGKEGGEKSKNPWGIINRNTEVGFRSQASCSGSQHRALLPLLQPPPPASAASRKRLKDTLNKPQKNKVQFKPKSHLQDNNTPPRGRR